MPTDLAASFLNRYVIIYLLVVVIGQVVYAQWQRHVKQTVANRRSQQGLPDDILLSTEETLASNRHATLLQNLILMLTVVVTPFILVGIAALADEGQAVLAQNGLAIVFLGLLLWILISATDVARAFLGGLALKTVLAFRKPTPLQMGDRVTLKGIGGKVVALDAFFVTLQTANDDQISIPTSSLWGEVINSANAGERSSLCVFDFYLAPFASKAQRNNAEDAIWEAIQASAYYTPSKPMQIYFKQNPDSIQITAKAYVASTYNEPLFTSDVTRAFLDVAADKQLPLCSEAWRSEAPGLAHQSLVHHSNN